MMDPAVLSLTGALVRAETFQQAAAILGGGMLDAVAEVIEESPLVDKARVLRALVHVRPDDGYRKLAVIERANTRQGKGAEPTISYVPSATAWRWVARHLCAVSIDAALGRVQPHVLGAVAEVQKIANPLESIASQETRDRLMGRQATHICAFPLRSAGGSIDGMVTVEAEARAAIGRDFLWELAGAELQALVDIAAPHVVGLPQADVEASPTDEYLPVVGRTMAPLIALLRVFALQEETILVSGPTGAGKSRLARWCKEQSSRKGGPFEVLDLMTVPEELQMAELFGWRRGAFTGAVKDSSGSVGRAEGGTLFIDEVDKLSLKAQAGLLHLLEERTYRPLGDGGGPTRADVRFIIGTNASLLKAVQAGQFREDLYYRINVLPLRVPPLDERSDEIGAWAAYMLRRRHLESAPGGAPSLTPAAARALTARRWPGNLRQLDNVVRRAYAMCIMKYGGAPKELVMDEPEIERALVYEEPRAGVSLVDILREAARRFVIEAESRRGAQPLNLDLAESFKGFVLAAAEEQLGSKEEAYKLLGKEALLVNRNHHKPFKREIERVLGLYEALGEPARFPYKHLLES